MVLIPREPSYSWGLTDGERVARAQAGLEATPEKPIFIRVLRSAAKATSKCISLESG